MAQKPRKAFPRRCVSGSVRLLPGDLRSSARRWWAGERRRGRAGSGRRPSGAPAVVPEDVLVEVDLQMRIADTAVGAVQPGLEVGDRAVGAGQVGLGAGGCGPLTPRAMVIAERS